MADQPSSPARQAVKKRAGPFARFVAGIFYSLVAIVLLFGLLPGCLEAVFQDFARDVDQPLTSRARGEYAFIKSHLQRPFAGYSRIQVLEPQFAVVALSHMACGLMNVAQADPASKPEVTPLLGEVVRRALSRQVSPYRAGLEDTADLGSHGLHLSHLNLILGCYRHVSGDQKYDALHQRIAAHLAAGCLADGDFHIRSYPFSAKWPADQTVTLCSLFLYDQIHQTDLSKLPIQGWLTYMRDHATDPATQLPRSSISDISYAPYPRGCALSWSSLYMAQFAPEEAAQLYQRFRSSYSKTILGCGGFREWPPTMEGSADVDSGPSIFGIGVTASGLGVGPARLFKDSDRYMEIMRAASVCGMPKVVGAERKYRLAPLLGEAILFHGVTATPWFGSVPKLDFPPSPSFPTGPLLMSLGICLVVALIVWRLRRLMRPSAA